MNRTAGSRTTYIILGIIIAGLSLYIGLRKRDRMQYTIPNLETLTVREIDRLEIARDERAITIARSGESWHIQPAAYRAEPAAVGEMLSFIAGLKLSDLASVTGNYSRYDLDEQSRIRVTAYGGGELLRRFDLGKGSPSLNQTFIRIDGDDRVFQTWGNPGAVFGLSEEDLRDWLILSFDPEAITEIKVQGSDWTVNLTRSSAPSRGDANAAATTSAVTWRDEKGEVWPAEVIHALLDTLSGLDAFRYLQPGERLGSAIFTITLVGDRPYTLEVFPPKGNLYPARSSESKYPFALYNAVTATIMNAFSRGNP